MSNRNKNKKEALLLRKEQLLRELQYYDKRIEDTRNSKTNSSFYDDDSSDSEEFPEFAINSGPSLTELKLQASMLRTCLHATQELTNLQILQSEVNVMVEEPVFEGEPPVTESGVWREVTAECRADLVPFSVSFNVHTPDRQFAPISYRNLQVVAIKSAHDKELSKSVLPGLRTPSEAVEVFLSYARAHRSRRCSLARLADSHADKLLMEPRAEGGYSLRCSRLRLVWELQNKWSPLAPFTHRLNFDLDYMDESYIKIVSSAHRQLSEPSVDTDERTRLLAKIIDTCLQAGPNTEENNTPGEDTPEKQIGNKPENPGIKAKDSELMAPPTSVPMKGKSKLKRSAEDTSDTKKFKRQRSEISGGNNKSESVVSVTDGTVKSNLQAQVNRDEKSLRDKNKVKSDSKDKQNIKTQKKVKNVDNTHDTQKKRAVDNVFSTKTSDNLQSKIAEKEKNVTKNTEIQTDKQIKKIVTNKTKTAENDTKQKNDNIFSTKTSVNLQSKVAGKEKNVIKNTEIQNDKQIKKIVTNKTKTTENDTKQKNDNFQSKVAEKEKNVIKNTELQTDKQIKKIKTNNTKTNKQTTENDAKQKTDQVNITITKSVENLMHKSKKNTNKQTKVINNKEKTGKENNSNEIRNTNEIINIQKAKQNNIIEKSKHLSERFKIKGDVIKPVNTMKNKNLLDYQKTNKIHKIDVNNKKIQSQVGKKSDVKSKIPQKRSSTDTLKKNPLRISPRKLQTTLSSTQTSSNSLKNSKTNIPRLLKKPSVKPK